jgi:hypothetical protein
VPSQLYNSKQFFIFAQNSGNCKRNLTSKPYIIGLSGSFSLFGLFRLSGLLGSLGWVASGPRQGEVRGWRPEAKDSVTRRGKLRSDLGSDFKIEFFPLNQLL